MKAFQNLIIKQRKIRMFLFRMQIDTLHVIHLLINFLHMFKQNSILGNSLYRRTFRESSNIGHRARRRRSLIQNA